MPSRSLTTLRLLGESASKCGSEAEAFGDFSTLLCGALLCPTMVRIQQRRLCSRAREAFSDCSGFELEFSMPLGTLRAEGTSDCMPFFPRISAAHVQLNSDAYAFLGTLVSWFASTVDDGVLSASQPKMCGPRNAPLPEVRTWNVPAWACRAVFECCWLFSLLSLAVPP